MHFVALGKPNKFFLARNKQKCLNTNQNKKLTAEGLISVVLSSKGFDRGRV